MLPVFLAYALSFVNVGIYWNNHHHMLHATSRINGKIMLANLHLLFWLSLFPYMTAWMGENHYASIPTAAYGVVLFAASLAYWVLQNEIVLEEGPRSRLAIAVGRDRKGKLSQALYLAAIALALFKAWLAQAIYVGVALMWLVPDRRIEKQVEARG